MDTKKMLKQIASVHGSSVLTVIYRYFCSRTRPKCRDRTPLILSPVHIKISFVNLGLKMLMAIIEIFQ